MLSCVPTPHETHSSQITRTKDSAVPALKPCLAPRRPYDLHWGGFSRPVGPLPVWLSRQSRTDIRAKEQTRK